MRPNLTALAAAATIVASLAGCTGSEPDAYPLGPEAAKLTDAKARDKIASTLEKLFGNPSEIKAPHTSGVDIARAKEGRRIYAGNCLSCHGEYGDGAGPGSAGMNPLPRDFRRGTFKFTTTSPGNKPTRGDLVMTLRRGMPLAKMPSFAALEDDKLDWLAEYVVFVAFRGEVERKLAAMVEADGDFDPSTLDDVVASVADAWKQAPSQVVNPPVEMPPINAATLARGKEIFLSPQIKCYDCHGAEGRGDGQGAKDLKDDWGNPLQPRNLTLGVYRSGSRPIDLFRTVSVGVKGTPMPAFGTTLSPQDIWAVVLYAKSLGAPRSNVW